MAIHERLFITMTNFFSLTSTLWFGQLFQTEKGAKFVFCLLILESHSHYLVHETFLYIIWLICNLNSFNNREHKKVSIA